MTFNSAVYTAVISCVLLGASMPADSSQRDIPEHMYMSILSDLTPMMHTAMRMLNDMLRTEAAHARNMRRFGRRGSRGSSFKFVQTFLGSSPYVKHLSYPAYVQAKTLKLIKSKYKLSNHQVRRLMEQAPSPLERNSHRMYADSSPATPLPDVCPFSSNVECDHHAPYRSYDGKCNNLNNPHWGSSNYPLSRFIPPHYEDAVESPRVSITGAYLPSARTVSSTIHWDVDYPHHVLTHMVMQFGQFLDHDLSRTAITKLTAAPPGVDHDDLEDVECGQSGCETRGHENQACLPISVAYNDTVFGKRDCLMFVRSQEAPNPKCRLGPREQLNQVTSYLDCSHVYGSNKKGADEIRDYSDSRRGGMLLTRHTAGRDYKGMLPRDPDFQDCQGDNRKIVCFKTGDGRSNEFSGITTQHLLWVREHNRIEAILHRLNPHWHGDKLYHETRRIVIAMWQFIIYAEYLPILLGRKLVKQYELAPLTRGYYNAYKEEVNPSVANSFATAAMRFGHSLIQSEMEMRGRDFSIKERIKISTQLRRPHLMYASPDDGSDAIMRGMVSQSSQRMDSFITRQVTQHLFADHPPAGFGEDLAALNIQRAREHGIPGYNEFREYCGLPRALHWGDLAKDIPKSLIHRFKRLYRHVDDIDLFPVGIAERPYPGALLGPTFSCILGSQFHNLKHGDRFWFENAQHNPHPFTQAQLKEIRKVTMAKVMCVNGDYISHIQPYVFFHPLSKAKYNMRKQKHAQGLEHYEYLYNHTPNEVMPCEDIPEMDFLPWREDRHPHPNKSKRHNIVYDKSKYHRDWRKKSQHKRHHQQGHRTSTNLNTHQTGN